MSIYHTTLLEIRCLRVLVLGVSDALGNTYYKLLANSPIVNIISERE